MLSRNLEKALNTLLQMHIHGSMAVARTMNDVPEIDLRDIRRELANIACAARDLELLLGVPINPTPEQVEERYNLVKKDRWGKGMGL